MLFVHSSKPKNEKDSPFSRSWKKDFSERTKSVGGEKEGLERIEVQANLYLFIFFSFVLRGNWRSLGRL